MNQEILFRLICCLLLLFCFVNRLKKKLIFFLFGCTILKPAVFLSQIRKEHFSALFILKLV